MQTSEEFSKNVRQVTDDKTDDFGAGFVCSPHDGSPVSRISRSSALIISRLMEEHIERESEFAKGLTRATEEISLLKPPRISAIQHDEQPVKPLSGEICNNDCICPRKPSEALHMASGSDSLPAAASVVGLQP